MNDGKAILKSKHNFDCKIGENYLRIIIKYSLTSFLCERQLCILIHKDDILDIFWTKEHINGIKCTYV